VSLMTRKDRSRTSATAAAQRARDAAGQVVPMAKNAVPKAKNVGLAAKQSAEGAVAWAAPRVKDARHWAAPHVEHAGLAVRDKIAPAISEKIAPTISSALVDAAHRLDGSAPRRRRWPRVLAGFAMLAAAGSAVAAAILRRKPASTAIGTQNGAASPGAAGDEATPASGQGDAATEDDEDAKANGRVRSS
jgi:hypothetical protein